MLYNYFIIRLSNKYSTTIASVPADNVQLVTGGHDQVCAAVGSGVIYDGLAFDGIGTVECIAPAFNRPILNEKMLRFPFALVLPHFAGSGTPYNYSIPRQKFLLSCYKQSYRYFIMVHIITLRI